MANGLYVNLLMQLDKLYKHNRQGSYKTRLRYYEAMQRFCRFLADTFRLEKLSNIAPKHIYAYVKHLREKGNKPSTIKTDLCAIRFWYDQISNPRYKLPDNSVLDLVQRSPGTKDRAWTYQEFERIVQLATDKGRVDYVTALMLAYYCGMRVEECFTVDTSMAEKALRDREITFHGKGGRWRTVPIDDSIAKQLKIMLGQVKRGSKLLTPDGLTVSNAISRFQNFICDNRDEVKDDSHYVTLTAHGLRHSFACNTYLDLRTKGFSYDNACQRVAILMGHNRKDVTQIYLVSVLKGGGTDV